MTRQIIEMWLSAQASRPHITASTTRTMRARVERLKECIGESPEFDEETMNKIYKLPNKYAYVHRIVKTFTYIARWATEQGLITRNPLASVKIKQPNFDHTKIALSLTEFETIATAKLLGSLSEIRDTFILQCRTGWAYADLREFHRAVVYDSCDRTWIKISRRKTGKVCPVPCGEEIMALLKKYNWELNVPSNQAYNRYLKRLAKATGIQKRITSHVARKTFAQHWLDRGAPPHLVSQMMGNTERVLMAHYGGLTERTLDAGLKSIGL